MQGHTLGYVYNVSVELCMVVHCGNNRAVHTGYELYGALVISIHPYVLEINSHVAACRAANISDLHTFTHVPTL